MRNLSGVLHPNHCWLRYSAADRGGSPAVIGICLPGWYGRPANGPVHRCANAGWNGHPGPNPRSDCPHAVTDTDTDVAANADTDARSADADASTDTDTHSSAADADTNPNAYSNPVTNPHSDTDASTAGHLRVGCRSG